MLADDVQAFDDPLGPQIVGLACLTTETLTPEGPLATHRSLSDHVQAFLRLTEDDMPIGPPLQYLQSDMAGGSWSGPRVDPETTDAFIRAGRLADL